MIRFPLSVRILGLVRFDGGSNKDLSTFLPPADGGVPPRSVRSRKVRGSKNRILSEDNSKWDCHIQLSNRRVIPVSPLLFSKEMRAQ